MPFAASEVIALGRKADPSRTCWVANILAWGEYCERMKLCRVRVSAGILEMTSTGTTALSAWAISSVRSLASNVPPEGKQATESRKVSHGSSPSAGGIAQKQAVTLLASQSPSQSPQQQSSSLGFRREPATSVTASFSATDTCLLLR